MANLKYRVSDSALNKPNTSSVKGTPLTNLEMDGNFKEVSDQIDLLVTNASPVSDVATNAWVYPLWVSATSGQQQYKISSTKLRYNPNTDTLIATRFQGTADNVTTNANLTGMVTSVGNATTVVTNANLTGMVTSVGNATTVVTNANLTGMVTSVGNATTVVTNANLTGEVTSVGNATTVTNSAVIGKVLTGFTAGVGTVEATDTILAAIQKLAANDGINAAMTGEATSNGTTNAVTLTNSAVIAKVLTGYTKGSGTVAATDSILAAVQKLDGNADLKAPLASPTFTGTPAAPTATADTDTTQLATTAFVLAQGSNSNPVGFSTTAAPGSSKRYSRQDHVHPDIRPTFRSFVNTANQTLTSAAATTIVTFNSKNYDSLSTAYDTSAYKWTPGTIAYYDIKAKVAITGTDLTSATIEIWMNTTLIASKTITGVLLTSLGLDITDTVKTTATGDTIEIRVSATGTSPVIAFGTDKSYFTGTMISKG